jgi:hypothetical protein
MTIEAGLLFEVDTEQSGDDWILVVQQTARVGVLTSVLEQPVEARLVPATERPSELRPALFDRPQRIPIRWVRAPHR